MKKIFGNFIVAFVLAIAALVVAGQVPASAQVGCSPYVGGACGWRDTHPPVPFYGQRPYYNGFGSGAYMGGGYGGGYAPYGGGYAPYGGGYGYGGLGLGGGGFNSGSFYQQSGSSYAWHRHVEQRFVIHQSQPRVVYAAPRYRHYRHVAHHRHCCCCNVAVRHVAPTCGSPQAVDQPMQSSYPPTVIRSSPITQDEWHGPIGDMVFVSDKN